MESQYVNLIDFKILLSTPKFLCLGIPWRRQVHLDVPLIIPCFSVDANLR